MRAANSRSLDMYWNRKEPASSEKPVTIRQKAAFGIWAGRVSAGLRDNGMSSTATAMKPQPPRSTFRPIRLIETFSNAESFGNKLYSGEADFVATEKEFRCSRSVNAPHTY